MVQELQAEIVFAAEPNAAPSVTLADIEWLVALLRGRGWMTAAKLETVSGGKMNERKIRAIASAARPGVVSFPGSKGYKLWADCTIEEIHHCTEAWRSQIRDNTHSLHLYEQAYYKRMGATS